MVKSPLDLWYEMWDRAGSQGLDTWYDMRGRLKGEDEPDPVRGPNVDGLDDVQPEPAGGAHEGK
jgi:hypothetical protein